MGSVHTSRSFPLRFRWVEEERPGAAWLALFERTWPSYLRWFLKEGDERRPDLATCRAELARHMPELLPIYEELVALAGGDPHVARMLSLYCPTPYLTGCSQAVWTRGAPMLARNYDYHPGACEGTFLCSGWSGGRTLVASDCLWGVLDGLNAEGLAVSLAFGGRREVGVGFGIPLILRYVLETCFTTAEAAEVLQRVPSHMSYNVSLLDARGEHAVVAVAPDRPTAILEGEVATNHQPGRIWTRYDRFTRSAERERHLRELLEDPELTADELVRSFLRPPLYSRRYERAFGTLYTAAYTPTELRASYRWPNAAVEQSLEVFTPGTLEVRLAGEA